MNIYDILNNSCSSDGELGTGNEMENMDITLNYENPELMSSEFFDSVFSLEQEGFNLKPDDGLLSVFEDDMNLSSESSSHIDEVFSPKSFSSESDKNSVHFESNDDVSLGQLDTIDNINDIMSFLESVQTVKSESQVTTSVANNVQKPQQIPKQPTKIVIQNPNNKKIFVTKPLMPATQLHKRSGNSKSKQQILRVQSLAGNGRSVLLPINVKSIKILNPSDIRTETIQVSSTPVQNHLKRRKVQTQSVSSSLSSSESIEDDDTDVVSSTESQYPALHLTSEEKRLLAKEGIHLPAHYPLTKNEERELKRIRRKIRNKISAQDSRKRKKEYVDGLEERVKRGSEENKFLLQRIKQLQKQNGKLMAHLSKLQSMIFNSSTSKAAPTTCLMIVLLSALLVSLPNIRLPQNKEMSTEQEQVAIRRALLSSQQATEDDTLNMDEFLLFNKDDEDFEGKLSEDLVDIENITDKDFSKLLEEMGSKYGNLHTDKNCSGKESLINKLINNVKRFLNKDSPDLTVADSGGGYHNDKGFIEPDIDDVLLEKNNAMIDDDPPSKRMKYNSDEYYKFAQINEHVVPVLKDATQFNSNTVSATVKPNNFAITSSKDK